MKKNISKFSILCVAIAYLCGCGSSSGDDDNGAPTITATLAQSINERTTATGEFKITGHGNEITNTIVSQISGPEVGDLQVNASSFSFVAPEVTQDTAIAFEISATDDDDQVSRHVLNSQVIQVNRAPEVTDQNIAIEFNTAIEFSLSAIDLDGDKLTYQMNSPSQGELTLINEIHQNYRYTPAHNAITDQVITLSVSDGSLTTTAQITLDIVDTSTPLLLDTQPKMNTLNTDLNQPISLIFSDNMQAGWLTDDSDTLCAGAVELSLDNFSTCLPYQITTTQLDDRFVVEIQPTVTLNHVTDYALKLSKQVTNFHGTPLAEAQVLRFRTEHADLLISEVSSSTDKRDNRWLEIYNGTASTLDLANYEIVSDSIKLDDLTGAGERAFPLSSQLLSPGEFIIVQGQHGGLSWSNSIINSSQLMLIGDGMYAPLWSESGYVELRRHSQSTVDFVRFGQSSKLPRNNAHWSATTQLMMHGQSIARPQLISDSNSARDWQAVSFATPAGPNDVLCTQDDDLDGIPDCAELPGSSYAGMPLYDWGARLNRQDIFIEVDYMESEDALLTPQRAALDKVKMVFAQQNIAVHFDAGNLFHTEPGIATEHYDIGGGNQLDYYPAVSFETRKGAPSILDHKALNFDLRRRLIFHYLLMGNSQNIDGSPGSSGAAEFNGNDLLVTLGGTPVHSNSGLMHNMTVNLQASTILHELGHNLGLSHGGDEQVNYKPNHYSSMNYLYQLDGLPTTGYREGDRYYQAFYQNNTNCFPAGRALINGPLSAPQHFKIDYSHGVNTVINESSINEALGLHHRDSTSVDFNCNGSFGDILINFDVNRDNIHNGVLRDYDEWGNLTLDFANYSSGANNGQSKQSSVTATPSIMHSDAQHIVTEQNAAQRLFELVQTANSYD